MKDSRLALGVAFVGKAAGDVRRRVGRSTIRAIAAGITLGIITAILGGQAAALSIEAATAYAAVVAVGTFGVALVLQVGALEVAKNQAADSDRIKAERIGVHKAIYAWVDACEIHLADDSHPTSAEQELEFLVANVKNSLAPYWFMPESHSELVQRIAYGDLARPADERLRDLIAHLKKQLAAGAFLV